MCTNYVGTRNRAWVKTTFGIEMPEADFPPEAYPGYLAPIVRLTAQGAAECLLARFGLIPHWAKDETFGRRTYNARSETVAEKPSYRTPWRKGQVCLALADAIFEPCYESGRAVRWRIARQGQQPMAIASLWDSWTNPDTGEIITSFTMLTVNADHHPVMQRFHKPEDEKRSVVIADPPLPWLLSAKDARARLLIPPEIAIEARADPRKLGA
jgi:putative SOS response-associated peptidase YedK